MAKRITRNTTDERAKSLVLWARREGIALTSLSLGDLHIELVDQRLGESGLSRLQTTQTVPPKPDQVSDIYKKYGGELYEAIEKGETERPPVDRSAIENMMDAEDEAG